LSEALAPAGKTSLSKEHRKEGLVSLLCIFKQGFVSECLNEHALIGVAANEHFRVPIIYKIVLLENAN